MAKFDTTTPGRAHQGSGTTRWRGPFSFHSQSRFSSPKHAERFWGLSILLFSGQWGVFPLE